MLSFFWSPTCRDEAFALRALLSIWPDHRHRGHEDHKDEGAGLRGLQRARRVHQRTEATSGLPFLQQAHGRTPVPVARTVSGGSVLFFLADPCCVVPPEDTVRKDRLRGHHQGEGLVRRQGEEEGQEEESSGAASQPAKDTSSGEWCQFIFQPGVGRWFCSWNSTIKLLQLRCSKTGSFSPHSGVGIKEMVGI